MVLVRRYNARRLEEAKKEGQKIERKRWQAWYDRLSEEVKAQQPPPPETDEDEKP